MSSAMKFRLNRAGVRAMLRSPEMLAVCEQYAQAVQARCGEGYEVTTHTGSSRVNASVYAKTVEARRDNLENNTIIKAVKR